ncbi:MAG: hypothetical protein LBS39_02910 [Campylobacteraceae bacterium]|jgi:hypothetical protein|nr:hypothetical protein [Campylobacteraceae bacterium]
MKKIFKLVMSVLVLSFLVGCGGGGGSSNDSPGAISGLGDASGEVTGEVFQFPDGVILEGDVLGIGGSSLKVNNINQPNYYKPSFNAVTITGANATIGSGSVYVRLVFSLNNTNNVDTEVVFPAGLVAISTTGDSQNGLLIKETSVVIPANSRYKVVLIMYCANLHRATAGGYYYNNFFIVSNSSTLQELFDLVKDKKINNEEYDSSQSSTYSNIVGNLQDIVWSITDDANGLNDSHKEYIANLPDSN